MLFNIYSIKISIRLDLSILFDGPIDHWFLILIFDNVLIGDHFGIYDSLIYSVFQSVRKLSSHLYSSSHNHGSVKNGCISNRIVSFHLGAQSSTTPWLWEKDLVDTSPKTNMDTQNDGLEKVDSFTLP